jgi:Cu/Ag efflux pump CusA
MRWLIGWGGRNRRPVVGFAAVLILLAGWQLPKMRTEVLPEFAPPTVEVQTEALGLSAVEVEQLITVPMEQDLLNGVAYLKSLRSKSVPGLSSIEMVFESGTPIARARQVVQERLTQAHALPNVSKPPQMLQPKSSASRIMMIGLSSKKLSPIELGVLARWTLRPNLLGVDGVSNVAIFGQRERQLQVQVDPARLAEKGVGLDTVIETTGNALWVSPLTYIEASTPGAGGFIETPNQRLTVQHQSPIVNAEQLAAVALEGTGATRLTLGDVATVVEDHQPLIGEAVFNDEPGLLLVVEKAPGQSTAAVTENVEDALDLLAPGLTQVTLDTDIYQPAEYVKRASESLRKRVAIGAILAALVLLASLAWRGALVAASSLLVAGSAAGLTLLVRDSLIDSMIVAGFLLALAFVVDDVVSATVSVLRRLHTNGHRGDESTTLSAKIREGVFDHSSPAIYALAITFVTCVPLLILDGLSSEAFIPPLVRSYLLAVVASAVVVAALVPALNVLLIGKRPVPPPEPRLARAIREGYSNAAASRVSKTIPAVVGCVVMLSVGVIGLTRLDSNTVPRFRETDLLVSVQSSPGTSLGAMQQITARMNADLRKVDGVRRVGSHLGRATTGDQVVSVNDGELWVRIDDDADYARAVRGVNAAVKSYPGVRAQVTTYTNQRLNDVLDPDKSAIDVRIYGEDRDRLIAKGEEIKAGLADIKGVRNPQLKISPNEPSLLVKVDLAKAQKVGILPGDVRRAAATLLQGIEVGNLFENQKVFEVIVVGTSDLRSNLTSVKSLLLETPSGTPVRLGDVADVGISATPTVIERDASARVVDIVADVRGRSSAAVSSDVEKLLRAQKFDLGYHAQLIGDYQDHRAAVRRVWVTAIIAGLIALLILQAACGSWKLAASMLLTVPAAMVGAVLVVVLDGGDLTLGHLAGLVGTIGLAVRNITFIVRRSQQLELDGIRASDGSAGSTPSDRFQFIARASAERASSVVISTVVSAAALLPIAVMRNSAGGEIVSPMAITLVGGMVSCLVVGLWIVPAFYNWLAPNSRENQLFVDEPSLDLVSLGGKYA